MRRILKNKFTGFMLLSVLIFALTIALSGCSDKKNSGPGETTTEAAGAAEATEDTGTEKNAGTEETVGTGEAAEATTGEGLIDLAKDAAEGTPDSDEADKTDEVAGSTDQLSEEEEKSLEVAGEIGKNAGQADMAGEAAEAPESGEISEAGAADGAGEVADAGKKSDAGEVDGAGEVPDEAEAPTRPSQGKNRVYVFTNDVQDFSFYVPEAYKDKTMSYGDGGAVVYTGNTTDGAPYYTINRYKTNKGAYVYALWEAMALEDQYEKYLAGPGVSPEQVDAGNRVVFRVKADYLDPDSGRGMQEFIYVEQLKDGVIVYKTKYYTDDKENVKATQSAVNLAINNICMSAEYDPDHLGPNHIGIPEK